MHPNTDLSVVLNRGHDVRLATALVLRAGLARAWVAANRALDHDGRLGMIWRRGDAIPGRPSEFAWIGSPWSEEVRSLASAWTAVGVTVSVDADGLSISDVLADRVVPVLSDSSLVAILRAAKRVQGGASEDRPTPLAAVLAMSPGRTSAEAHARVRLDPEFARIASTECAIVGTIEECQQAVAALLAAGVSDLRVAVPATSDLPDVLAQLATLRSDVLRRTAPGMPRSRAPAPPRHWGGRP